MAVWARRPAAPQGTVLLVHGRTWSSRPDFDLQVPGLRRSVMQSLADRGFAAYAVDLRGYGETPRDQHRLAHAAPVGRRRSRGSHVAGARSIPRCRRQRSSGWSRGRRRRDARGAERSAPAVGARAVRVCVRSGGAVSRRAGAVAAAPTAEHRLERRERLRVAGGHAARGRRGVRARRRCKSDPIAGRSQERRRVQRARSRAAHRADARDLRRPRHQRAAPAKATGSFVVCAAPRKQLVALPGADHAAQLEDTHDAWVAAVRRASIEGRLRPFGHSACRCSAPAAARRRRRRGGADVGAARGRVRSARRPGDRPECRRGRDVSPASSRRRSARSERSSRCRRDSSRPADVVAAILFVGGAWVVVDGLGTLGRLVSARSPRVSAPKRPGDPRGVVLLRVDGRAREHAGGDHPARAGAAAARPAARCRRASSSSR